MLSEEFDVLVYTVGKEARNLLVARQRHLFVVIRYLTKLEADYGQGFQAAEVSLVLLEAAD